MNICMISGFAKYTGGVENVVAELSSFLINRNAKVTVFGRHRHDFLESLPNLNLIGVCPYYILPKRLRFAHYDKYVYNLKVWRKTASYGPFDIIHGHGDNCFFSSLFRGNEPFVMTFHGTMLGGLHRIYGSSINPKLFTMFYPEKIAAMRCDLAIACSFAVRKELIHFYRINPCKIQVIHNGVNINRFRPFDKKKARRMLGLRENKRYGIWVGTNARLKGLSTAIKSVEGLRDTYLLVVGFSGINFENVIFWGSVQDKYIMSLLYNAADFLIFPTIYEGFPLVPLEALACGLPIIVSKESNLDEIIKEGSHGFVVKNGDPLSYKEKIEFLLSHHPDEISIKCRDLAVNFSWEKQAEKYWKIYLTMLDA